MPLYPPQRFRKVEYIHRLGTLANQPAAADVLPGTLYLITDTGRLQRSDGAAWSNYAATTFDTQVIVNGNFSVTGALAVFDGIIANTLTVSTSELIAVSNITQANITTLTVLTDPIILTSGAIRFPAVQVPSAGANDLDDYEEGNWTPAYNVGGSVVGITYSSRFGSYTKIGNQVFYYGQIVLTSKGAGAGVITITGLPFSAANNPCGDFDPAANYTGSFTATPFIVISGTTLFIVQSTTGARGQPVNADFQNTSDMRFSGTYLV